MKIAKLFVASLALLTTASLANAGSLDDITKRGELRVAVQTQGPPFSMVDQAGKRTGSSVELAELMAKEMGVKITFQDYDWDGLIPALLSGKADLLVADMTPTLARAMKVAFTKPFMYTGSAVFAKTDSKFGTMDACKAKGTKIAVLLGATGEKVAKETFPDAEIKSYKGGGPLLLDAVVNGQADCGVNDVSAVKGQQAAYPAGSITIMPEVLSKEPLAFATRYDEQDLLVWMNLFLDQVALDGRLQKNLDYWVNSEDWKKDHQ
ncbi:amino acid ABC transporter substrate-binding protein, PAAT family [Phyllobacterium sp. YR620]|jgi:polar amino acid transport system substrate-binding protein|uniref:ABC transporter substrate-binding protein n=1 Tax=unclassified Phyllobacterium TaxID=2638441 RepID=UPI000485D4D8|nr:MULTISPECIES: ABC transporter substrate-binding protein [unclassified Phyllobacterium]SDO88320.1 amino acid ABC transporter substrate-binding protein, PAAT family [Phyllobacterium sp. YR620]SFJ39300.1 amino acid ABC transporter substrate-binding protein, PAAT family [Phyllobacterium sp. CL33Tsu]